MRQGRISVLAKARSLSPYAPRSSSAAHGPEKKKKKSPRVDLSDPPHFPSLPFLNPPPQQEVWLQPETTGFPLGLCDPVHVPTADKSRLTSSQMLGQFSNTQGPTQMHRFVSQSKAPLPTHTPTTYTCRSGHSQLKCYRFISVYVFMHPHSPRCKKKKKTLSLPLLHR